EAAEGLTEHAVDESSPVRLQARYMLRRTFWRLAPAVVSRSEASDPTVAAKAKDVFFTMVDLYPLEDIHHHGGWKKRGLIYERLGRYDLALEAYREWRPSGHGCGTCEAAGRAERVERMVRCHRELNQLDRAVALCWTALRESDRLTPLTDLALILVDLYEQQDQLDRLAEELEPLNDVPHVQAALEYIDIRRDFQNGDVKKHLKRLLGARLGALADIDPRFQRDWRSRVAAEGFGRMGKRAVPILEEYLQRLPDRTIWVALWAFEALRLTESPAAVDAVVELSKQDGRILSTRIAGRILEKFPEHATAQLVTLLEVNDTSTRHVAVVQLANLGREQAVSALIEHMPSDDMPSLITLGFAERCVWGLWRLTGESLGMEEWPKQRLAKEAQVRWRQWWRQRRSEVQEKSAAWWQTPEAAPLLVKALGWPTYFARSAERDLMALEHPALVRLLEPPSELLDERTQTYEAHQRLSLAEMWMRFDPAAAMPIFIECADTPNLDVKHILRLMGQDFGQNEAAWREWWEADSEDLTIEPKERWW
ncbi:MAG: tetratricopeptide repeat protein, partial [Planctomycetes bacterium]|nr:tetratricopeptide repeat protein [Planctomycetota bacterium]